MNNLLEVKKLKEGCPIMVAKIPQLIVKELDVWVKESRKYKDSPLAALKAHENVGYLAGDNRAHNSYQTSIPPRLIEESYWLGWVLRLSAKHYGMGRSHRFFKVRSWSGHFDGYDVWTNFAYKGDDNPSHSHAGFLSGVIYYKNHGHPTIFDDFNCQYEGKDGTMVIFPSDTRHHVEEQTSNKERITIAFNIMELPQNEPNEL
tara:strand:+ start:511 stop:1119 length:609 start_codon:yes stop_codon:yes gene_type:complete